jgi:hypothetical protein
MTLRTAGSNKEKRRGSLWSLPREGVSSNPSHWSGNERLEMFPDEGERGRRHPPHLRPVAAMTDASGSPEILGANVFYHHSARGWYQSSEELNANSST